MCIFIFEFAVQNSGPQITRPASISFLTCNPIFKNNFTLKIEKKVKKLLLIAKTGIEINDEKEC